jgi:glycine dehydrogenase subunit 2
MPLASPTLPNHRGLSFDEPLLIEQSAPGRCGVDMPPVPAGAPRTGQPVREAIGLPQVSEPQVVRHFTRLSQMNYSIDSGFYPLGSCTMKHNPRLNEQMARLPGFAQIHPLQPTSTVQGALALMWELQEWLGILSGLPAVTLTPAAGAHGELAGMMVIRAALDAKGGGKRVVLVPDSAHGTNPATAAVCGFEIRTIPSTSEGIVDRAAFHAALDGDVGALMLTNPNTCGIFEPNILEIAEALHAKGAYFYCDGANFNAIMGRVRPADLGVDVMHFNLHKTFSTPHGGGGPGSGPIAVREELRPFLPVPRIVKTGDAYDLETESNTAVGRMKGFHGHFGMAVRALAYMLAHGGEGLKQAAENAVLNANYILSQLKDLYHVPFPGVCMHECLLTDKHQKAQGVAVGDIAKTLIEYGFHPMTVQFPLVVPNAMLIEPTESETRETLDQFIAVMRAIAEAVSTGKADDMKTFPVSAPRTRLDEVRAARQPKLRW